MIVAFALLAITRLTGGDVGAAASVSPSAAASAAVLVTPSPSVDVTTPSPAPPSEIAPSPSLGPSAPVASPSPATTFRTTYTVKSGDTLLGIASKFGTTVAAIKRLNGLNSNTIHVGQKLKIP
jgi:LysM repeat protein